MNKYEAIEKLAIAARVAHDGEPILDAIAKLANKADPTLEDVIRLRHKYRDDARLWGYIEPFFYSVVDGVSVGTTERAEGADSLAQDFANAAEALESAFPWTSHNWGHTRWHEVWNALTKRAGSVMPDRSAPTSQEACAAFARDIIINKLTWAKETEGMDFWRDAWRELGAIAAGEGDFQAKDQKTREGTPRDFVHDPAAIAEVAKRVIQKMDWADQTEGVAYWTDVHAKLVKYAAGAPRTNCGTRAATLLDEGMTWYLTDEGVTFWGEVHDKLAALKL